MTDFMMVGDFPIAVSFLCIPLSLDVTDCISNSGWYYQPGMAQGNNSILHVLAKKASMDVDTFTGIEKAVFIMKYQFNGKVRNQCEKNLNTAHIR